MYPWATQMDKILRTTLPDIERAGNDYLRLISDAELDRVLRRFDRRGFACHCEARPDGNVFISANHDEEYDCGLAFSYISEEEDDESGWCIGFYNERAFQQSLQTR